MEAFFAVVRYESGHVESIGAATTIERVKEMVAEWIGDQEFEEGIESFNESDSEDHILNTSARFIYESGSAGVAISIFRETLDASTSLEVK